MPYKNRCALVAELEDAQRSGRCSRKGVEVQILSRAHDIKFPILQFTIFNQTSIISFQKLKHSCLPAGRQGEFNEN